MEASGISMIVEPAPEASSDGEEGLSRQGSNSSTRSAGGGKLGRAKQQFKDKVLNKLGSAKRKQRSPCAVGSESGSDQEGCAGSSSSGFFSPPTFQLTQIIHDNKCFFPRKGHCCVNGGGDVLIFGGLGGDGSVLNDFIRYIPGLNVFEPMKKLNGQIPKGRAYSSLVNWVDPKTGLHCDTPLSDMWSWDGEEWLPVSYDSATEPMSARCGHSASVWVHRKLKAPCVFFFGGDTTDMHTYDLQANCWFALETHGSSPSTSLCFTNLVLVHATRTVYSFGCRESDQGDAPSSDVYRLSPLITYVSFSALRNQVESLSQIVNVNLDQECENIGKTARKIDVLLRRVDTLEKEVKRLKAAISRGDSSSHSRRAVRRSEEPFQESLPEVDGQQNPSPRRASVDIQATDEDGVEMEE